MPAMAVEKEGDSARDDRRIVKAEVAIPIEWQDLVKPITVNDELGEERPGHDVTRRRRNSCRKGKVSESDFHGRSGLLMESRSFAG